MRGKVIKKYVEWKGYDNSFNSWIKKRFSYLKMSYFPESITNKLKIEIELDFSIYATKYDLKNSTGVDTSQFSKNDLANLKSDVDKLDIDKLKTVPVDLSKLMNAANNGVIKKDAYNTDKIDLDKKNRGFWKKIPHVSKLVTESALNMKIGEVENKIPNASKLVTNSALNTKIEEIEKNT